MTKITEIVVFGSNRAGRHGKGAALAARQHHGAIYGQGEGLQGRSYAIPTKDERIQTLPLEEIEKHVAIFRGFAFEHPGLTFRVTEVACGLAGYTAPQIAPFFENCPNNVILPQAFIDALLYNRLAKG